MPPTKVLAPSSSCAPEVGATTPQRRSARKPELQPNRKAKAAKAAQARSAALLGDKVRNTLRLCWLWLLHERSPIRATPGRVQVQGSHPRSQAVQAAKLAGSAPE